MRETLAKGAVGIGSGALGILGSLSSWELPLRLGGLAVGMLVGVVTIVSIVLAQLRKRRRERDGRND